MKVLHCITQLSDAGGAEKLLQDLLPALQERGVEAACAVLYGHDSENKRSLEQNGIRVFELSYNTRYYNPLKVFKLLPIMRRYDIVHAHNTPAVALTFLAGLFCKRKIVMTLHSTADRLRDRRATRGIARLMENRFDGIICCSKKAEENLRAAMTLTRPRIVTANNGINLDRFIGAQPLKTVAKLPYKKITMVAGFRRPKDHKCVIRSMAYLPEDYHLFLIGDGELKAACMEYAKELKTEHRVHFLGLRHDVPQILKASDFIVLASHYEGLSLSTVEGMAAGKPLIASDVEGIRDVVGGAGILFPDGDAKMLADTIMALDRDKEKYGAVAQRCRQRAMLYDMAGMADGYKRFYAALMAEKNP